MAALALTYKRYNFSFTFILYGPQGTDLVSCKFVHTVLQLILICGNFSFLVSLLDCLRIGV